MCRTRRLVFLVSLCLLVSMTVAARGVGESSRSSDTSVAAGPTDSTEFLPISGVTLFTSGVGYFQHDGYVDGTAEITLSFDVDDINDLLKSLVLQDFDGGHVEAVTYPSQDPLSRILESFSLNITDNPSIAQLLDRARGEEVVIEARREITGIIAGTESRVVVEDGVSVQTQLLNLITSEGVEQISLRDVETIRFSDEDLQEELGAALNVIAEHRQQDKRLITIRFTGEGRRRVRIGYIREVPVWKSSYRLVLGDEGDAQLQGWAMVENTGELDWQDVSVALVAGQPISFVMDLYSPIYVTRPRLQPNFGTVATPQQYSSSTAIMPSESRAGSSAPSMARSEDFDDYLGAMSYALEEAEEVLSPIDLSQGVQVDAQAESASVYRIAHPLTVPRREAALIPIIGATVPAERLAIYDRNVLSSHPLAGVRITNTSDVQLPSGPATVFDGATYGGDSQIPSMVSGDERLISYAVDLGTSVIVRSESVPRTITSLRITDGVMDVTQREQLTTEYVLDRVAEEPVRHLVMHPKRYGGWTIIGDTQPLSETQSDYRFEIDVPGGSTETLGVIEELIQHTAVQMSSISDSQITYYLSQNAIDDETASILSRIRELRSVLTTRRNARGAIENEIRQIYNDQSRIRQNLEALEPDTELYDRYLTTLADQEDRLEQLQRNLSVATAAEEAAQTALNDYIAGL